MTDARTAAVLSDADLAALTAALETLRAENVTDLEHAQATKATLIEDHSASGPSLGSVIANADYMIEDATGIIARIDAALRRIADGTYGVCTKCGQPIPLARLELRPYGDRCVGCSS